MRPLSEQFSQARKLQLDAQFKFLRTFTGNAFERIEKVMALNFDASRASLEKSSEAMRQIVAAKDPRDLLALTSGSQTQFDSALAYSIKLFDIAASVPPLFVPAPAPAAAKLSAVPAPAPAAAPMPAVSEEPTASIAKPEVAAEPAAAPIAKAKPIAKAAGKLAAKPKLRPHPSAASFPAASTSKAVAVAHVNPVNAAPPHAPVSGTPEVVAKRAATAAVKPARKK
jgi:phasin family protein